MDLKALIRDVVDFPKPGIVFKDITPLLQNPQSFRHVAHIFAERYRSQNIDLIVGIDARGFLFGSVLAYILEKGLVIARKKGKLPYQTIGHEYNLEYGEATIELHNDAIRPGDRVLIVDDLLATGGTAEATAKLVEKMGGKVIELAFVIELSFLQGRERLQDYPIYCQVEY